MLHACLQRVTAKKQSLLERQGHKQTAEAAVEGVRLEDKGSGKCVSPVVLAGPLSSAVPLVHRTRSREEHITKAAGLPVTATRSALCLYHKTMMKSQSRNMSKDLGRPLTYGPYQTFGRTHYVACACPK